MNKSKTAYVQRESRRQTVAQSTCTLRNPIALILKFICKMVVLLISVSTTNYFLNKAHLTW